MTSRRYIVIAVCTVAAIGLSHYASQFAIDFEVYRQATWVALFNEGPLYGPGGGVGWPMHYRYPPVFTFFLFPFALLPAQVGAFVWTLLKCAVLVALAKALTERLRQELGQPHWLVALCLAGPYVVMEFRYGNAQFFVFALTAWALLEVSRKPRLAAILLGLVTAFKIWPLYFVPLLVVRGKRLVAAGALLTTAALMLLPAFYFGWTQNLNHLNDWYEQESSIVETAGEIWFPSQSLLGVMTRHLTEIDYSNQPDPNYPAVNSLSLDPDSVYGLWLVLTGSCYDALLWLAKTTPASRSLTMLAVAWCALPLLQPYSHKTIALVVLVWPALVASASVRFPCLVWQRTVILATAVISFAQVFTPSPYSHRLVQVLGLDALIGVLLLTGLDGILLRAGETPQERVSAGG